MRVDQGKHEKAAEYADFLFTTELGKKYYPRLEIVESSLERGLAQDVVLEARKRSGELTGLIWFQRQGAFHQFPYLHIVAVADRFRGRGLGSALVERFEQETLVGLDGKRIMRTKAFLVVDATNAAARAFYAARGYEQVAELDGLYRRGVVELLMTKTIAAH